jgi:hypothetical protein
MDPEQSLRHTIEVAALNDDLTKIDPDAQDYFPILRGALVGGSHGRLQLGSALDRIDCAGELHQDPVAHGLDQATKMSGEQWLPMVEA